ncbi:MAG: T9SS type A sorting domain-containing protein, partial [Bacteroidetes bacterium]|nr:T9SS type A sorting domain-containing protein [Bacteroidota bacterium]
AIAQGFVMKTTGASSADYTNAMRSQGSTQFKSNDAWYDAKLNIEVSNGSYGDISYIYFNQNASSAFDAQWDCEKRYSDAGRPTIYSKTGSVKTSLNGNNMADLGAYSFPLGLNPGGNHTCTFTVTGLETLPASSLVYLEDKVTGTWTNLREVNTYSFSMTTQENEERFELHFTKPILISYEAESCEGNDGSIYVDFGNQSIAGSLVSWNYDISKDMQSLASDSESDFLALESLQPGTYEISLANGNYQFMESIVIEDKIQVEVNVELPTLDVYTNEQFLINNLSQGADTYTWEINNESFNTIDLSYSFSQAGIYPFSILASNVDCNALYNGTITVLDKTTGIKESVALADVMVYTKDNTIVVDLSKANLKSSTQLEVYSIVGQILTQKFNVEEVEFIEMANQAKGYYFVRIINNQDQVTKKVLIK